MNENDAKYVSKYELEDLTGFSRSTISRKVFTLIDADKENEYFKRFLVDGKWLRKVDKEFALKLLYSSDKIVLEEHNNDANITAIAEVKSDIADEEKPINTVQNNPDISDNPSAISDEKPDISEPNFTIEKEQSDSAIAEIPSDIADYKLRIQALESRIDSVLTQNSSLIKQNGDLIDKNNELLTDMVDQQKRFDHTMQQFLETYKSQLTDSQQKNTLLFQNNIDKNPINTVQTNLDISDNPSAISDEKPDISEPNFTIEKEQSDSAIAEVEPKRKKKFWFF
jgi:hypothetical protein